MVNGQKIVAIIQCRLTSSRLPAKAMLDLGGKTLLERTIESTKRSSLLDEIWVATSTERCDDLIEWNAAHAGCNVFRGDLNDVLNRYAQCAIKANADVVVRVTADNPLTSPALIDFAVGHLIKENLDYVFYKNIPHGSGAEAFSMSSLLNSNEKSQDPQEREHVNLFIRQKSDIYKVEFVDCPMQDIRRPDIRVTIDTLKDYEVMARYYHINNDRPAGLKSFIRLFDEKRFL